MQANYFDHADQLGTSISIYRIDLNELEQRLKKVSFARFYVQKFKRTCTCVHGFSEKNDYCSEHLQTLDYHPGKFYVDSFSSF
jgi:hypothetical protein